MRRPCRLALLAFFLSLGLPLGPSLGPSVAFAHGGLPISEAIFFQGDTLVVPTQFWGVFLGKEGGPWRWICEEAINKQQALRGALPGAGPYHDPHYPGTPSSRDGGRACISSAGDLPKRAPPAIVAAPASPRTAWATT